MAERRFSFPAVPSVSVPASSGSVSIVSMGPSTTPDEADAVAAKQAGIAEAMAQHHIALMQSQATIAGAEALRDFSIALAAAMEEGQLAIAESETEASREARRLERQARIDSARALAESGAESQQAVAEARIKAAQDEADAEGDAADRVDLASADAASDIAAARIASSRRIADARKREAQETSDASIESARRISDAEIEAFDYVLSRERMLWREESDSRKRNAAIDWQAKLEADELLASASRIANDIENRSRRDTSLVSSRTREESAAIRLAADMDAQRIRGASDVRIASMNSATSDIVARIEFSNQEAISGVRRDAELGRANISSGEERSRADIQVRQIGATSAIDASLARYQADSRYQVDILQADSDYERKRLLADFALGYIDRILPSLTPGLSGNAGIPDLDYVGPTMRRTEFSRSGELELADSARLLVESRAPAGAGMEIDDALAVACVGLRGIARDSAFDRNFERSQSSNGLSMAQYEGQLQTARAVDAVRVALIAGSAGAIGRLARGV